MADLTPYPAYKDSAIPWLGQIPAHWEVLPGFAGYRQKQVKNLGLVENQVLSLSYGRIVVKPVEKLHGLVPASFETYQIVDPGNIIIRPTDLQNDWNSLRVGIARDKGIITSAYICLHTVGPMGSEYGYLLLNAYDLMKIFYGMGSGLRQNLDYNGDLKRMPILVPPPDEQAAIARYLDAVDRRIRRYIRAKQKLIKLLEEQKQAIIHQAVTRGLDPNVPLKDAGVEWLGQVPAHWEVKRVKQVSQILRGKFSYRPRNDPSLYGGPYPFIQTGDVARATKTIKSYKQSLNEIGLSVSKMFPAGTLVMTIAANIGDVAVLDFEACFPDSVVGFVPRVSVMRDFLYYTFIAMKPELLREAPVNTQGNLNVERIGARLIAVPPLTEQEDMVKDIEIQTSSLQVIAERTRLEIDLIREYRTRLIADVVTGQVDVRGAAASWAVEDVAGEEGVLDEGWADDDAEDEMDDAVLEGEE